jgi:N-methylhydantoinase A
MSPRNPKSASRKPASRSAAAAQYFCGIDIGGTFTDCVVRDQSGRLTIAKSLSTPEESSRGFFNALEAAAIKMGISLGELMSHTQLLLHGTTLGTNALLERKGAKTGLLSTRGHADAIIMMRSVGRSAGLPLDKLHHVSRHQKPAPIVPRNLIREISERVDFSGEVLLPLNEEETRAAVSDLLAQGVQAIGICFLWGFANPAHEIRAREIVREMAPDIYVTCGHELISKPGEYERSAAVAINCFIGPLMSRYVFKIEEQARSLGYKRPLVIMQSSGGVASAAEVAQKPVFTIGSGPAGGLTSSAFLANLLKHKNVIASDVGGTSFDVGLVTDGIPLSGTETTVNQYTFSAPHLDLISIGSGGGSIIWVEEKTQGLKVGPESAGANPGPACYGRGGQRPAVTDADLVLGYYNPEYFLGGKLKLDTAAASSALEKVGRQLGMTAVELAAGAVQIVEFQMAELMRQMTVERGFDPRDFIVYGYGGAAGAHVAEYTRELGCRHVVVPLGATASTWSALGVQTADLLHVHERSRLFMAPFPHRDFNQIFEELERSGRTQLAHDGIKAADVELERSVEMKFKLQIHTVEVPVPSGKLSASHMKELESAFIEKYERTHGRGSAFTAAGIEIGLFRVRARGRIRRPSLQKRSVARARTATGKRPVYWRRLGRFRDTPIYDGALLGTNAVVRGPAIVQLPETTIVVPPQDEGHFDGYGNFLLTLSD